MRTLVVFLAVMATVVVCSARPLRFPVPQANTRVSRGFQGVPIPKPDIRWFPQKIDHFNFQVNPATYQQRYFVSDKWYNGEGPIFFYTGNEGSLESFWQNTGFMFDAAPEFNALVVFGEHRYYGESMPFGKESFKRENVGYLSVEQALADYVSLLDYIKKDLGRPDMPVVSFGGSYGGMLTAWFRQKYPGSTVGGIAASAPIFGFKNEADPEYFANISSRDYRDARPNCDAWFKQAFAQILEKGRSPSGRTELVSKFEFCSPLNSMADVQDKVIPWMNAALQYAAMVDYPYSTSFLQPLPPWPVKALCNALVEPSSPDFLDSVRGALGIYYNFSGQAGSCFNVSQSATDGLGLDAWDYQTCTTMVLPEGNNGIDDMYLPPAPWDEASWTKYCQQKWGTTPDYEWIALWSGGYKFAGGSNIVFSNGNLDPWSGGGVQKDLSPTMPSVLIQDGAHHLDLRSSNSADPQSVVQARLGHKAHIKKWLMEHYAKYGRV